MTETTMSKPTKKASPKPEVLRKLGSLERYQTALFALDYYAGTTIACRYSIPDELCDGAHHDKLVEHLELAVADTVLQHPLLQVGLIKEKSRKPYYVKLDHVDLAQQIEWQVVDSAARYEELYTRVLIEEIDAKFTNLSTHPAWRLAVLRHGWTNMMDVIFVWNHSHLDGTGAKIFHQTLLQSLNKTDLTSRVSMTNHIIKPNVTAKNMPPSQSVLVKYQISAGFAANVAWQELKPPILQGKCKNALGVPHSIVPRETGIVSISVDNATLQKVLAACRTNNTTLTGLLHGIALVSIAPQASEKDVAEMGSETALNLRRFLEDSPEKHPWIKPASLLENCVNKMPHKFPRDLVEKVRGLVKGSSRPDRFGGAAIQDVMWSVSATVRGEIRDLLDRGLKDDAAGMMGLVPDWRDYVKDMAKKPRKNSWLVTNVGVIDGEAKEAAPGGGWAIKRSGFTLSADVIAPVFSISAVAVKGGDLCVDITWQDVVADSKMAQRLSIDMEWWFNHIANPPKPAQA